MATLNRIRLTQEPIDITLVIENFSQSKSYFIQVQGSNEVQFIDSEEPTNTGYVNIAPNHIAKYKYSGVPLWAKSGSLENYAYISIWEAK